MLGNLVQRFQAFSPVSSPVTSPKSSRRWFAGKSPARRRSLKEEYREVQSEPEDAFAAAEAEAASPSKKILNKRKAKKSGQRPEVSLPIQLQASQSMGRLDGIKQVSCLYSFVESKTYLSFFGK
ncbi:uncharacterized protein [Bemisia tabaci]|uniref:uncharacterized protein isoform X3 n=1 Tax=Bemisia tabaci TaxID=7038 RepID=UPI003B2892C0